MKRILACFLAIMIMLSTFPLVVFAENENAADVVIDSYEDLLSFADKVNEGNSFADKTIVLDVNINLGGEENPWKPIGTSSAAFSGTFNGQNHVISGLYMNTADNNQGVFGYLNGGTITNLTVGGSVSGGSYVGGIVGYINSGVVSNCANLASVKGGSYVGGVVGYIASGDTIGGCYNEGSISGTTGYVGGVVGCPWGAATITACYNTGSVSGPASVGGISGCHKARKCTLINCYNVGSVSSTSENANNHGAIVGATAKVTITNCYYAENSVVDITGNVAGEMTAMHLIEMQNVSFVTALNDTQFTADTANINNGYPVFLWQADVDTSEGVAPKYIETTALSKQLASYITSAVNSAKTNGGINETDTLIGSEAWTSGASSTGTDWMAFAMGRFGYFKSSGNYAFMYDDKEGYTRYLDAMKAYIEKTYAANGGYLHKTKATEWHRAIITILALGGDPTNFGLYNGNPINLVADGTYNNANPGKQGINGWIWGLLALDAGTYEIPADAKYTRENFIKKILELQLTDGVNGNTYAGWALSGKSSDTDITAMCIQALAPYYNNETVYAYTNANSGATVSKTVREVIDEALDKLGAIQNDDGDFASWGTKNVESTAQVIAALTSLGIDPAKDTRFITSTGKTLLDGLLKYQVSGGFSHTYGTAWNGMANDQATYALVSYWRFENGMRHLYDMRGNFTSKNMADIKAAVAAINSLPVPISEQYKPALKSALTAFRNVDDAEKMYVTNYAVLSQAIRMVGGEAELETDNPYIVDIEITKSPDKTNYIDGEYFDKTGMIVSANYNNGSSAVIDNYKLSSLNPFTIDDKEIYVLYGSFKAKVSVTVSLPALWNGLGTQSSPYLITSADDLYHLLDYVNNKGFVTKGLFFSMTKDIDLSSYDNWSAIGTSSAQFQGDFDGNNHVIKNLTSTGTYKGLFGVVGAYAAIRNLGTASGKISTNLSSFGGGIAGWSNGADIINCWNAADISGNYCGGIVGTVRDGGTSTISGCYNIGNVTGDDVGGIVGHIAAGSSTGFNVVIENCYNTGSVSGKDEYAWNIGGIAGRVQDGHSVSNCYNIGDVSGSNYAAAIVGWLTSGSSTSNCYYTNSNILGVGEQPDMATKLTGDDLKTDAVIAQLGDAFKADAMGLLNSGYPVLTWQDTTDAEKALEVMRLINMIGEVTLESQSSIEGARTAYNVLTESQKNLVSNVDVLTAAETRLDELQVLNLAKTNAKTALDSYKSSADYREAQKVELALAIEAGKTVIDGAVTIEEVNTALANAKSEIDEIKTDAQLTSEEAAAALAQAKADAKTTLDSYKNSADYREAQKVELALAIETGKTAIDGALTIEDVNIALANAKSAIDEIKTDAQLTEEEQNADSDFVNFIKKVINFIIKVYKFITGQADWDWKQLFAELS